MKKKIVLKLGSHVLTQGKETISISKLDDVAKQLVILKEYYDIIIVSSGAVAAAKGYLIKNNKTQKLRKQTLAAIGQPILMKKYQEVFSDYQFGVAQCLFTYNDFDNQKSIKNSKRLIKDLWKENYIPIVNENDSIATDEIKFGDNDKLAALTANLVEASLLVLASDIDGLYTDDPKKNKKAKLIKHVSKLSDYSKYIQDSKSKLGTGGMSSKFKAAEICMKSGIEMWIVNGMKDSFLLNAVSGNTPYTSFLR